MGPRDSWDILEEGEISARVHILYANMFLIGGGRGVILDLELHSIWVIPHFCSNIHYQECI